MAKEFPCLDHLTHRYGSGSLEMGRYLNESLEAYLWTSADDELLIVCSTRGYSLAPQCDAPTGICACVFWLCLGFNSVQIKSSRAASLSMEPTCTIQLGLVVDFVRSCSFSNCQQVTRINTQFSLTNFWDELLETTSQTMIMFFLYSLKNGTHKRNGFLQNQ